MKIWPRLVSGAKLAPQGRLRTAQGASPGNKHSNKGSPEGAMQLVPVPKMRLMTSIHLELRCTPCAALSALSAIWPLNPGLAPWAVLLDPCGVLGSAPETSLAGMRARDPRQNGNLQVPPAEGGRQKAEGRRREEAEGSRRKASPFFA